MILYPTPMGAITSLYAATAPEAANFDGKVCLLFLRAVIGIDCL